MYKYQSGLSFSFERLKILSGHLGSPFVFFLVLDKIIGCFLMKKKIISVVTPTFNEEGNIKELIDRVSDVLKCHRKYDFEHIIIDNASTDRTVEIVNAEILKNKSLRLIVNSRNFGHIRSPYHGMLQAKGDAVLVLASDLQDPPELIPQYLTKWEEGYKSVLAVKIKVEEGFPFAQLRRLFYFMMGKVASTPLVPNATGAGLIDRSVVETLRRIPDPYPYFRGLIADFGHPIALVEFEQPKRHAGISKNNFFTLFDLALLGVTNHSRLPLRIVTLTGFVIALASFLFAVVFFVLKLLFWSHFPIGQAPLLIAVFFFGAVQIFVVGFVGEYVGSVLTKVSQTPLVIESERVNFDD